MAARTREADQIPPTTNSSGGGQERLTVSLLPKAVDALEQVSRLTGESKTDSVNRALILYAWLHQAQANNGGLYIKDSKDSEPERIRVL